MVQAKRHKPPPQVEVHDFILASSDDVTISNVDHLLNDGVEVSVNTHGDIFINSNGNAGGDP